MIEPKSEFVGVPEKYLITENGLNERRKHIWAKKAKSVEKVKAALFVSKGQSSLGRCVTG